MPGLPATTEEPAEVDGTSVRCLIAGDGPPLLLLHGGGLDSAMLSWREVIPALADQFTVYAPDWPGYGASDSPAERPTTDYYRCVLIELLDRLQLESFALVGISMGGGIALSYALDHPGHVSHLVLVDSYGLGGSVPGGYLGYLFTSIPYISELTWALLRRSRWLVTLSLRAIVSNTDTGFEELVDEAVAAIRRPDAGQTFREFQRAEVGPRGLQTNYVDRLPDLAVPTLVVHGESDPLVPDEWGVRAGILLPDAEVRILPHCGHWPSRKRPERLVEGLRGLSNGNPTHRTGGAVVSL